MEDNEPKGIIKDIDYEPLTKAANWMAKHPHLVPWFQVAVGVGQVAVAALMLFSLYQNSLTLQANNRALELQSVTVTNALTQIAIEQETRLNPELECAYNWASSDFTFRNVGDAPADVIFLETDVYLVRSNEVLIMFPISKHGGSFTPPLDKPTLKAGGDVGRANKAYVPDMDMLSQAWKQFGGDILISLKIEFRRTAPTFRHYFGYFDFTPDYQTLELGSQIPPHLLTTEEDPYLRTVIQSFNSRSDDAIFVVSFQGANRPFSHDRAMWRSSMTPVGGPMPNGAVLIGSWAKLRQ